MHDGHTVFFMVKNRMVEIIRKCPALQQVYWSCLFARGPDSAYDVYNREAADFNDSAKEHNKTVFGEDLNNLRFMSVDSIASWLSSMIPKKNVFHSQRIICGTTMSIQTLDTICTSVMTFMIYTVSYHVPH